MFPIFFLTKQQIRYWWNARKPRLTVKLPYSGWFSSIEKVYIFISQEIPGMCSILAFSIDFLQSPPRLLIYTRENNKGVHSFKFAL